MSEPRLASAPRATSALLLAALLSACGGTYTAPSSPDEIYRKRIERLESTATTEKTAGTLMAIVGLVGTVAGTSVMVERAAHGDEVKERWVGATTASASVFLTGLFLLWSGSKHESERDRLELSLVRQQQLSRVDAGAPDAAAEDAGLTP